MKTWTSEETAPHTSPWKLAVVMRVIDGDTLELMIDLGFDTFREVRCRLLGEIAALDLKIPVAKTGVDAWETRGGTEESKEKGLLAKVRVEALCPPGSVVRMFSRKGGTRDSFRRWLGVILTDKISDIGWCSVGDQLLTEGHAVPWEKK